MNCRRFQDDLYEYLDGALSPGDQAAAEKHLSECAACCQKLTEERQVAQVVGRGFRQATERLELPSAVSGRVLAALGEERSAAPNGAGRIFSWLRLAWPVELAASAMLILGLWVLALRGPGLRSSRRPPRASGDEVSVQLSYIVPAYTFRQEDGFVIDALTYQTNTVNERFQAEQARLR